MKKTIILLAIIILLALWYFLAPIKWTFGFRSPKNYQECVELDGVVTNDHKPGTVYGSIKYTCIFQSIEFNKTINK